MVVANSNGSRDGTGPGVVGVVGAVSDGKYEGVVLDLQGSGVALQCRKLVPARWLRIPDTVPVKPPAARPLL